MPNVIVDITVSLDGFVTGEHADEQQELGDPPEPLAARPANATIFTASGPVGVSENSPGRSAFGSTPTAGVVDATPG
jgi:hypothetical protein